MGVAQTWGPWRGRWRNLIPPRLGLTVTKWHFSEVNVCENGGWDLAASFGLPGVERGSDVVALPLPRPLNVESHEHSRSGGDGGLT